MRLLNVENNISYYDIVSETLFPSFICSCSINIDPKNITNEIYQIKKENAPLISSNEGGYHSPYFVSHKKEEYDKHIFLTKLLEITKEFVNNLLFNYLKVNKQISEIEFWSLINKSYDYNILHLHPHSDLIGVYYASLPKKCGNLVIIRNDSMSSVNLGVDCQKELIAQEGKLYVFPANLYHYVMTNVSDNDRISVAFNFKVKDF